MQGRRAAFYTTLTITGALAAGALGAADIPLDPDVREPAVPLEAFAQQARSGGPGKDGIPAIDEPRFVGPKEAARFLQPEDVVFGVRRNGVTRAYPQRVLVWHEIVNDRIGGENVSITYCPLTGTAIGFLRGDTTFGVSGNLVNSNLIMYDRATDSHWPQILGIATKGPLQGEQLREFQVIWTTWEAWRRQHPDTEVLSHDTGYLRNYNRDPYGDYTPLSGYYQKGGPFFPVMHRNERLAPKRVVIGVRAPEGAAAFDKEALRRAGQLDGAVGEVPVSAFYDPALDAAYVYRNPERRRFERVEGGFAAEGRTWRAAEIPLEPLHAFDAFWFAWAAFYPDTELYGA